MAADHRVELVAVFAPEHGLRGTAQTGAEGHYVDRRTRLPVWGAYGKNGPALADVVRRSGVDTVVFDIQDVGARFYTYIWTLYDTMMAAAVTGKRYVVLDRPNPTSGLRPRGPVLDRAFGSFVGRREICQQHAMTVGELARLYAAKFLPDETDRAVRLDVVPMRRWQRDMVYADTGLPWVMPSANMPTPDTALVYSGTGLIEGTNLSEGRGTTRPFELIGAPYLDDRWVVALCAERLPGVLLREASFVPATSKWVGRTCGGVQLHVTDPHAFDPLRTAVAVIVHAKRLYGPAFAWKGNSSIDRLSGSSRLRAMVDAGAEVDAVVRGRPSWPPSTARGGRT